MHADKREALKKTLRSAGTWTSRRMKRLDCEESGKKKDKIGLETLIENIFRLPGSYLDTSTERIIALHCQNKNRNCEAF
jgi:hypothetical protein